MTEIQFQIFCHPKQVKANKDWEILNDLINATDIKFTPLLVTPSWHTDESFFSVDNLIEWDKSLKTELGKFDFTLSDNLSSILEYCPDTVLIGSFLWSEVLIKSFPQNPIVKIFHEKETENLTKYNPPMICIGDIAMPYVIDYTEAVKTSWPVENILTRKKSDKIKNILVSPGGTEHAITSIKKFLGNAPIEKELNFYIPKRIKDNDSYFDSFKVFDFQSDSFLKMDLLIARPGVGAITDSVTYQIPMVAIGENNNPELAHNSGKIQSLGFGLSQENDTETFDEMLMTINSNYSGYYNTLMQTTKKGIEESVQFIISHFNIPLKSL